MSDRDDDELTCPLFIASTMTAPDLTRATAWHFRCSHCDLEAVLDEPVSRAPECTACGRFMAPVNRKRGQA